MLKRNKPPSIAWDSTHHHRIQLRRHAGTQESRGTGGWNYLVKATTGPWGLYGTAPAGRFTEDR